jgi:hypothetical protein
MLAKSARSQSRRRGIAPVPGDYWAYELLAAKYKARGDLKRWQETLEQSLQTEDRGLNHAKARVAIANHFMQLGQWHKAQHYAEAAAATWAEWAMRCAQYCAEGMHNWGRAELWARRISERYPNFHAFVWLYFCKRTGRGDLQAARELAEQYIEDIGGAESANPEHVGIFCWLCGEPAKALGALQKAYELSPSASLGVEVMLLADQGGDQTTRDAFMKTVIANHRDEAPESAQVCELLEKSLSEKGERLARTEEGGRASPEPAQGSPRQPRIRRRALLAESRQGRRGEAFPRALRPRAGRP